MTAIQIDALWSGLNDPDTGQSYAGAIVGFFEAGTSTPKAVWYDKDQTLPSAAGLSQVTLSSNGIAKVYGDGVYKINVYAPEDSGLTTPLAGSIDGAVYVGASDATKSLDTLAELGAYTGSQDTIYIKGRTTTNDGGQGVWVLTAGDFTDQLDDDTLNGVYLEYSGEDGSTRAWVRQLSGYVTPRMFGATGYGVTSDYAAMYNCILFALTYSYEVFFPKGSYLNDTQINVVSPSQKSQLKMYGEEGAIIINNVASGSCFYFASSASTIWNRLIVKNFKFVSTTYPSLSDSITINGPCFGGGVYGCDFRGESGSYLQGDAISLESNAIDFGICKNMEFKGNTMFYLAGVGIHAESANSFPSGLEIDMNDIELCAGGGIYGTFEATTIKRNIFAYNGATGNTGAITIFGNVTAIRNTVVRDNQFEHNASYHVKPYRVNNFDIINNLFIGLADGVQGMNNSYAIISNDATYGIQSLTCLSNRIGSPADGYTGINLGANVVKTYERGTIYQLTGAGTQRRTLNSSIITTIYDDTDNLYTTQSMGFAANGSEEATTTLQQGTAKELLIDPGYRAKDTSLSVVAGEVDWDLDDGYVAGVTCDGTAFTFNNPTNIPGTGSVITIILFHTAATTITWGSSFRIEGTYTQNAGTTFDILRFLSYSGKLYEISRTIDMAI